MHTPAPPSPQDDLLPAAQWATPPRRRKHGFSLIEVTLAIAIIAFAFVALIGLLPAGLSIFQQTVDSTNEMRIVTNLTSMLQSTEFEKLTKDATLRTELYFFDVDGGFLDTESRAVSAYDKERVYVARLLFDDQNIPVPEARNYDRNDVAIRAIVVSGKDTPAVRAYLKGLSSAETLGDDPPDTLRNQRIRAVPLVISKTDGLR